MELKEAIAKLLIRTVNSLRKDWPEFIQVQAGIEDELRQMTSVSPIDTADFLRFLLASGEQLHDALLISTLPSSLQRSIGDLLMRRNDIRIRKEDLVNSQDYDRAASCLDVQQQLTQEVRERLAGESGMLSIDTFLDTIRRIGWPVSEV